MSLLHPRIARRSCDDCRKYLYTDDGLLLRRGELPVLRPAGTRTPCHRCPKIPSSRPPEPASAVEMTADQYQAWEFYRECRATGQFPTDPWSRWLARVFRAAEDSVERESGEKAQMAILGNILSSVVRA